MLVALASSLQLAGFARSGSALLLAAVLVLRDAHLTRKCWSPDRRPALPSSNPMLEIRSMTLLGYGILGRDVPDIGCGRRRSVVHCCSVIRGVSQSAANLSNEAMHLHHVWPVASYQSHSSGG